MHDAKLQSLKTTALFNSLSEKHLGLVANVAERVLVKSGTRLVRQGAIATHMSVVVEGSATAYVDDEAVAELRAGDAIGEFAMVDDLRASATVIADTDMIVWHIGQRPFMAVWHKNPNMSEELLEGIVARVRRSSIALADSVRSLDIDLAEM